MSLSMYQATIPTYVFGLKNLATLLSNAEAHAAAKKIDPSVFVNARLYPDMFPLSRQVQIATDGVKGCVARLAGIDIPSFPDTETTLAELQQRIEKVIKFIESVPADKIDGSETKTITLKVGGNEMKFDGLTYLLRFVNPNFYFHISTTYAILRHNGVEIGKKDYLGPIQ